MNTETIAASAALYFTPEQPRSIPVRWFERACRWLEEFDVPPTFFSAADGGFLIDECYMFAERRADLAEALRDGRIDFLHLDVPRSLPGDRSDWLATASVSLAFGLFHLGIDASLIRDPRALLRTAYDMAEGLLGVRYGIAYISLRARDSACYALGRFPLTLSKFRERLQARREGTYQKSEDELWADELDGQGRHLAGLFRGAYPASLLSESHLRAADLQSRGIGRLSELDPSLWLWELSASEIPVAEEHLETLGVLVRGSVS